MRCAQDQGNTHIENPRIDNIKDFWVGGIGADVNADADADADTDGRDVRPMKLLGPDSSILLRVLLRKSSIFDLCSSSAPTTQF